MVKKRKERPHWDDIDFISYTTVKKLTGKKEYWLQWQGEIY